jgi:hypothetical protein
MFSGIEQPIGDEPSVVGLESGWMLSRGGATCMMAVRVYKVG